MRILMTGKLGSNGISQHGPLKNVTFPKAGIGSDTCS